MLVLSIYTGNFEVVLVNTSVLSVGNNTVSLITDIAVLSCLSTGQVMREC
jgi:hypothetical protein